MPILPAAVPGSSVADPVEALRRRVTAATLTPFDATGQPRPDAVEGYARALAHSGVGALAVCVHTGRGPRLTDAQRADLVTAFRTASGLPVVAGVGVPAGRTVATAADVVGAVLANAAPVVAAGADALLCFPPPRLAGNDDVVVELHTRLAAETGLPVVAFALYEEASENRYGADLAARLVAVPGVAGIKVAMLDDAIACQDLLAAARDSNPGTVLLTGEDRMLGPSLMWGAEGSLVGLAAALPEWTVAVNDAWVGGRYDEFTAASVRLDRLAALVFRAPMDGYVQRMAWIAAWEGILDPALCHDPFGPPPARGERDRLIAALERLAGTGVRRAATR